MNYHEVGEEMLQQQKWPEAVIAYREAIANNPNFSLSYHKLGQALAELKKWEEAVEAYQKAIEINPDFSWSYHKLGEALTKIKRWEEAVKAYQKAIEFNPDFSWSYHKLGDVLREIKRWEEAVEAYQKAVELNPNFPQSSQKLAEISSKLSKWEEGIEAYQNLINLNPNSYSFYKDLWEILLRVKTWDRAAQNYRDRLKSNPKSYWYYYQLGYALKQIGLIDEAIVNYQKAIELKADLPWFHTDLADALLEKKESEEAIASYIKAIELQPDFYPAYSQLRAIHSFKLLKLTGTQLENLVNCYREAIKVKPDFAETYVNLGNIFSQTNRIEEASACYQKAIRNKSGLSHPELRDSFSEELRQPNFIIIGTIKGGTSSLYNYICTHPQVLPAIQKEVHFFDTHFNKGIDWYLAHFPAIPTDKNLLTGEASPNYMYFQRAAKQLFNYFPNTKLIVVLRNPIDRVVSHYYMAKRHGQHGRSLEEVIAKETSLLKKIENNPKANAKLLEPARGYLSFSLYVYFLKKWMTFFPREQFLILQSEEMYEGPEATMKQVFEFLELPDYQINQYRKYCPGSYSPIDKNTRETLSELFRPHNQRLEKYLGRQFNW